MYASWQTQPRTSRGQFASPSGTIGVEQVESNITNKYANPAWRGFYVALDQLGKDVIQKVIETHEATAWQNEPLSGEPGDLESTLFSYIYPSTPDKERFMTAEMIDSKNSGLEQAANKKVMFVGEELRRRNGERRILGQSEYDRHHANIIQMGLAVPHQATGEMLIISSPMEYAYYNEVEPGNFPVFENALDECAKDFTYKLGVAIFEEIKKYGR